MNEQELRRLSDCEVIIAKYHDQLQKYMDQVVNYNNQVIQKDDFDKTFESLKKSFANELNIIRIDVSDKYKLFKVLEKSVEDLSKLVNNHHEIINKQSQFIEKLVISAEASESNYANHDKKIAILNAKIPNWEKLSLEYEEFKRNLYEMIGKQAEKEETIKNNIQSINQKLDREQERVSILEKEKVGKEAIVSEERSKIFDRINEIRVLIDTKASQVKSELSFRLDQIKLPEPKEVEDMGPLFDKFKEELKKSHESLNVSVSKARAKSDVFEMQMKIFEKKLDNMYLVLKEKELTK